MKVQIGKKHSWIGWLTFSGVALVATICIMVFVPTGQIPLEFGALVAGLAAGFLSLRYGVQRRWMFSVILLIFVVVWFILGTAGYAWFGGFLSGIFAAVASVLAKSSRGVWRGTGLKP